MTEPTNPEPQLSDDAARRAKFIDDLKKQYPDLDVDMEPDPHFLSGTREERMERMRERVDKVAKYFNEENAHAPMPGNSEPWWKTFIHFEADLRENVDEKTREELNKVTLSMHNEGYTAEAISKGTAEGEKLLAGYPDIWERAKTLLFNETSFAKLRSLAEKNEAAGKPNFFPLPDVKRKSEAEGKDEELFEPLD